MGTVLLLDQYAGIGGAQIVALDLVRQGFAGATAVVASPVGDFADAVRDSGVRHVPIDGSPTGMARDLRTLARLRPDALLVNGGRVLPLAAALRGVLGAAGQRPPVSYVNHSTASSIRRAVAIRSLAALMTETIPVAHSLRRGTRPWPGLGLTAQRFAALAVHPAQPLTGTLKAYGRLDPMKGLDLLGTALTRLRSAHPDLTIEVAVRDSLEGTGDAYATRTRALLADALVRGGRDATWFQPGDLVVIPSRHGEGVSLTAQEAMARAAVVVVSADGDMARYVQDGETGFVFPAGSADGLVAAVARARALGPEQASRVARAGRATIGARAQHWHDAVARHVGAQAAG